MRAAGVGTTSGGVEAEVPPKTTRFGPFRIQKGRFAIGRGPTGDGSTSFELSTSVDLDIGPFNLTVDRIGMSLDLRAGGVEPNLGPARLGLRVQAPDRHRREDRRQGDPRRRVPRASTRTRASTPACSSCRSRA